MRTNMKTREFYKSMKYFNSQPRFQSKYEQQTPLRSSIDEKIDLLRVPVYQRKKLAKRSSQQFTSNGDRPKTINNHKNNNIDEQKAKESQGFVRGHYRYRSNTSKKNFLSWFRKTSGNLEETGVKKNIIDIVVMQKEIEKDSYSGCEKSTTMLNFKDKPSKSLANQDSQSLLRKNSLYLLNFMKRKENQSKQEEPHIGGIPNVATNMKIGPSQVKVVKQYTPSKNERVQKRQKIVSTFSKFLHSMPIDPW